ncbi:S-layer homology domain-containing protein, partial [Agathobaculum sp. LCP25S3_E8]|uniref:S-layer homology domain-containing protein n=1 Tax=Agathobaculum sp. LCP25S3_E8 TaxID=3438735 RepID=UPI003F928DB2
TPGTVAVIVNADGTEEIVKTSIPTENGVALTLAGSATVKIVDNAKVFVDIHPVNHWAKDAVDFASARGITGGTSDSSFSPNASCTRAQIVTFLWRAAGSPEPENLSDFSDVPADAYYAKAVAWALENGITGGTGNGMFSPDATCTRSQSVTFLYRAAGSPTASDGIAFGDVTAESYYADAVAWAAQNGITSGIGSGLFGPANECSRAQIVTFLYRFMVK